MKKIEHTGTYHVKINLSHLMKIANNNIISEQE